MPSPDLVPRPDLPLIPDAWWDKAVPDAAADAAVPVTGPWVQLNKPSPNPHVHGGQLEPLHPPGKISSTKMPQWTATAAGPCGVAATDASGNLVTTGWSSSSSSKSMIVQRHTALGKPSWTVTFSGSAAGAAVAVDTAGSAYVIGIFQGTVTVGAKSYISAKGDGAKKRRNRSALVSKRQVVS